MHDVIKYMMTEVHNPPHTVGDCYRACIATALQIPIEEVPHVFKEHQEVGGSKTSNECHAALDTWLAGRGFICYTFAVVTDTFDQFVDFFRAGNQNGQMVVVTGASANFQGIDHCIVVGSDFIHDPSPNGKGLSGPSNKEGVWWTEIFAINPMK